MTHTNGGNDLLRNILSGASMNQHGFVWIAKTPVILLKPGTPAAKRHPRHKTRYDTLTTQTIRWRNYPHPAGIHSAVESKWNEDL